MAFWTKIKNVFLRWIFPQFPPEELVVLDEVMEDIQNLAREAFPREFVAFLDGVVKKEGNRRVAYVKGLSVIAYRANHNSTSFNMWDLPMVHGAVGTVHSHPSGNTRPSRADLHLFGKFGWCHMIIGRPYTPDFASVYDKFGNAFPWKIEE